MATIPQRVKAIFDALTNSDTPNGKIVAGVNANDGLTPAQNAVATNDEKGTLFLQRLRRGMIQNVKLYEETEAVQAAQATVHADVDTRYEEQP